MKVSFEDIGRISATFAVDSGKAGDPVMVSGSGRVAASPDGDIFCGILEGVRCGYGAVQLHGFATVPYSGSIPSVGYISLSADGQGGVRSGNGKEYLVVSVDQTAQTCVIYL